MATLPPGIEDEKTFPETEANTEKNEPEKQLPMTPGSRQAGR